MTVSRVHNDDSNCHHGCHRNDGKHRGYLQYSNRQTAQSKHISTTTTIRSYDCGTFESEKWGAEEGRRRVEAPKPAATGRLACCQRQRPCLNAQLTRSAKSRRRKNVLVLFETYLESHQKRLSLFRWIGRQHRNHQNRDDGGPAQRHGGA